MTKTFTFDYTEQSSMYIDVEAETQEEAEKKLEEMLNNGDVDFSKLYVDQSHTELHHVTEHEPEPPPERCYSIRVSTGFAGNIHINAADENEAREKLETKWKDGGITIDDLRCDEYLDDHFHIEQVSDLGPAEP